VLAKPLAACNPSIFNSFPVIRAQVQTIAVFMYHSPHFCFPWGRPCGNHARKDNLVLAKHLATSSSFPVIGTASAKNRSFHVPQPTFFVSPGDAPPFGMEKLEWLGYPTVKKFRRYLYTFWRNSRT